MAVLSKPKNLEKCKHNEITNYKFSLFFLLQQMFTKTDFEVD